MTLWFPPVDGISQQAQKALTPGNLRKASATEIELASLGETNSFVFVNNEAVDISSNPMLVVVGGGALNTIDADGLDSGVSPAAAILHHVYLSNSLATFAPSSLRLSTVAPTDGYLGASGNAANLRHVGVCYTAASISNFNVCGYSYTQYQETASTTVVYAGIAAFPTYYALQTLDGVALMPDVKYSFSCVATLGASAANSGFLRANSTSFPSTYAARIQSLNTATTTIDVRAETSSGYVADTLTMEGASDVGGITISLTAGFGNIVVARWL